MTSKQRLNRLEKDLEKHTGGKIAKADKIQVIKWRTEKEREDKAKKRMAELLSKYPGASEEDFLFICPQNFDTRGDCDG